MATNKNVEFEPIATRCCGLDVYKVEIVATVHSNNKHSWQEVENVLLLHLLPLFRSPFTLHAEMICHIDFKRAISFSISSTTSLFAITSFWLYTIKTLPPYFSVKSSKLAFIRSDNE